MPTKESEPTTKSTFTPLSLFPLPDKAALKDEFVGLPIQHLRTPAIIIDRKRFKQNCEKVTLQTEKRGMKFRAHVKTHKTAEGTRMQAEAGNGVKSLIVSTLPELWGIITSGLVEEGKVEDILYSLPIGADRLEDINDAQEKVGKKAVIRLMVDHPAQIHALDKFNESFGRKDSWSVFVKVDGGGRRAGVPPDSEQLKDLVRTILEAKHVGIYGFYSHFGQSYASKTISNATDFFHGEIDCVNTAAKVARSLGAKGDWVLSVGATPTAHAATQDKEKGDGPNGVDLIPQGLDGTLELHAGNYCMNDMQQYATSLVSPTELAVTVLARVVSLYPHRNEAMCDAGALAMSKDTGPLPGFGHLISPPHATNWDLGRISQEHGTLVHRPGVDLKDVEKLKVGDVVRIVPQHACLTCAAYPWVYVVEEGKDEVVDVWVPWKGW